jgi:hypothetical protein
VKRSKTHLIRSITRHTRRKNNTPFNTLLDKRPRCTSCAIETTIQIHAPELVDFLGGEVKRRLVLCAACVADHAMQGAGLREDLVNGGSDRGLGGHVSLHGEEAVRVGFGERGELVAGFANVDAVDCCGAVGEAAVCYAEADSSSDVSF